MRQQAILLLSALIGSAAVAQPMPPVDNPAGEAALAERLRGWTAGKPVACVSARQLKESDVIAGTAVVYRTSGSRVYVNRPRGDLSRLNEDHIIVTRSASTQLCDGDIVDLNNRTDNTPVASASLGRFIPYDRPRRR